MPTRRAKQPADISRTYHRVGPRPSDVRATSYIPLGAESADLICGRVDLPPDAKPNRWMISGQRKPKAN